MAEGARRRAAPCIGRLAESKKGDGDEEITGWSAALVPTQAEHLALVATVSGQTVQAHWPEAVAVWETITGGRALTLRAIGSDQAPSSGVSAIAPNQLIGRAGSFAPGKWVKVRRSDGALLGHGQVAEDGSITLSIPKSSIPPGATLSLESNIWPYSGAGYARMWMEVRDGGTHYFVDLWAEGQINRDRFNWQAAIYAEVR